MERMEVTHNLKSGQPKKISAQCFFFFYKNMHNRITALFQIYIAAA
jgi:hypothetical protein